MTKQEVARLARLEKQRELKAIQWKDSQLDAMGVPAAWKQQQAMFTKTIETLTAECQKLQHERDDALNQLKSLKSGGKT